MRVCGGAHAPMIQLKGKVREWIKRIQCVQTCGEHDPGKRSEDQNRSK